MKRSNAMSSTAACSSSNLEAELGMDFIEKAFQEATIKVLMGATEGLNTDTLHDPQCCARLEDEEKAQFAHRPSEREANGKKWNEAVVEAAAGVEQAASNLQVKVTSCEQNVDDLLKSLKTWSAIPN
ncbi:hypothetical protein GUJ93_ZPchr0004g39872 [Zizania palustris]|uniref:Uncharacterized protein n=1 Tax=Zizania palustris TaxID=103762 RepID=A0A8J5S0Z3_ZIZPA|nr:hypothetical protein GUJ93_ZPchr0004g39872 [Zizania palustris]